MGMKLGNVLLLVLVFAGRDGMAQTEDEVNEVIFNSVLNRQFTKVVTGLTVPGNYGSFDVKEGKLTGAGMVKAGLKSVMSFKIDAGVSEGAAALFTNSKVNPRVAFEVNANFLSPFSKSSIITNADEEREIRRRMAALDSYYAVEIANLPQKRIYYDNLISLLSDSIKVLEAAIERTPGEIDGQLDPILKRKLQLKFSKLLETNTKVLHLRDSLELMKNNIPNERQLLNQRNLKWTKLPNSVNATGIRISWFSLSYKLVNNNFYLFDASKVLAEQLEKQNFTAHQFRMAYNTYSWRAGFGTWMLGGGLALTLDDSYATLNKTEVVETTTYAPAPNARTETRKYTAFSGSYEKDIRYVSPYLELYYFITRNQTVALHLFPESQFSKGNKPLTNIGTGLFFSFNDKADKSGKAKVNAELYATFNDVNNSLEKDNTQFLDRNEIGIRLNFPFKFNP